MPSPHPAHPASAPDTRTTTARDAGYAAAPGPQISITVTPGLPANSLAGRVALRSGTRGSNRRDTPDGQGRGQPRTGEHMTLRSQASTAAEGQFGHLPAWRDAPPCPIRAG